MIRDFDQVNSNGDVLIPMSPLDAVMNTYRVLVLYVYPAPLSKEAAYDLQKLQHSFVTLVEEDYPVLVGELHIDRDIGSVNVKQTPEARQRGGRGIRFEKNSESPQTSEDAMTSLSWEFMPKTRVGGEIIAVKGSLLADGGLAIGVDCSHILFDGESMITFMKAWGKLYSGVSELNRLRINHDRDLLSGTGEICHRPHPEFQTNPVKPLVRQADGSLAPKTAAKPPQTGQHVFHLSQSTMFKLKKAANKDLKPQHSNVDAVLDKRGSNRQTQVLPSYVSTLDAITALFTILISRARDHGQSFQVSTAVNGRRRLEPPLPANFAGNAVFHAISSFTNSALESDNTAPNDVVPPTLLSKVALAFRTSILERDNSFMRDTIAFLAQQTNPTSFNDNVDFFFGPDIAFTCWSNMGLYDAEFDGMHPSYASIPRVQCMDGFVLITEASKGRDGLDVLVCLECATMDKMKELSAKVIYLQEQS